MRVVLYAIGDVFKKLDAAAQLNTYVVWSLDREANHLVCEVLDVHLSGVCFFVFYPNEFDAIGMGEQAEKALIWWPLPGFLWKQLTGSWCDIQERIREFQDSQVAVPLVHKRAAQRVGLCFDLSPSSRYGEPAAYRMGICMGDGGFIHEPFTHEPFVHAPAGPAQAPEKAESGPARTASSTSSSTNSTSSSEWKRMYVSRRELIPAIYDYCATINTPVQFEAVCKECCLFGLRLDMEMRDDGRVRFRATEPRRKVGCAHHARPGEVILGRQANQAKRARPAAHGCYALRHPGESEIRYDLGSISLHAKAGTTGTFTREFPLRILRVMTHKLCTSAVQRLRIYAHPRQPLVISGERDGQPRWILRIAPSAGTAGVFSASSSSDIIASWDH